MASWFRAWNGVSTDDKLMLVAKATKTRLADVLAVWIYLLDQASQNLERGVIPAIVPDDIGALLDIDPASVESIIKSLRARKLIDGNNIANWAKRQPKREDSSADRMAELRAKRKAVTQRDAKRRSVTHTDTETETDTETDTDTDMSCHKRVGASDADGFPLPPEQPPLPELLAAHDELCERLWPGKPRRFTSDTRKREIAAANHLESYKQDRPLREVYLEWADDNGKGGVAKLRANEANGPPSFMYAYTALCEINRIEPKFARK